MFNKLIIAVYNMNTEKDRKEVSCSINLHKVRQVGNYHQNKKFK